MINLINVVLGGALLLAGRKLFWLFVGAVGFVTGLQLSAPIIIDGATSTRFADAAWFFSDSSFTVPSEPHDFTMQSSFTFTGLLIGLDESDDSVFRRELIGQ